MNMNVGSLTAAALKITANPFLAKFFPVPRQAHAAMGSAPQFAGKFFGTSRGGPSVGSFIEFEQPFLCTLKPNTSKILAAADCTADLTSLFEQGVLGNFTFGVMDDTTMTITNEFIPPPLSNFELTFKRDHFCKANDLIFVGTNVEAGRALNGTDTSIVEPNGFSLLTITGPFTLAQQVTLKGTRIYKSHYEFGF